MSDWLAKLTGGASFGFGDFSFCKNSNEKPALFTQMRQRPRFPQSTVFLYFVLFY